MVKIYMLKNIQELEYNGLIHDNDGITVPAPGKCFNKTMKDYIT